jgi:hypothetical protein
LFEKLQKEGLISPDSTEKVRVLYVKNIQIIVAPGLNHLFQHCVTCSMQEPATLKEDFAPEVLQQMKEWLHKHS